MSHTTQTSARNAVNRICSTSFTRPTVLRRHFARAAGAGASSNSAPGSRLYSPQTQDIVRHVQELLRQAGIDHARLEEAVLAQACTHKSGVEPGTGSGHGEKLGFLGRRVLRLHLTLFLTKALAHNSTALAQYMSSTSVDSLLETKELGANVGRVWKLEQAMRWREVRGPTGEMTGLYKSRGATVEALIGAVYSREGIAASDKLFREMVLPHLVLPAGLQRVLSGTVSSPPVDAPAEPTRSTVEL